MPCWLCVICMLIVFCGCNSTMANPESVDDTFHWIPEESSFVDYAIHDGRVEFRYSVCFVNGTDEDQIVSLSANFAESELDGWLSYKPLMDGLDESGERSETLIKRGEKTNVIYTFEGEYLGGPVNTQLSFPEELLIVLKYPDDG